ncbi:TRAP transporter substrate-binding protein [Vibrio sp. Isolate31]|uniref:TRAP transporter substrate-binding protein n=1 Tax=unclassified Vibrio TaxID=2614977 RepID=UPI001EFE2A07|nr:MULTISPECIES: TRAP transporter substrate-binding protein [unclassified Vibrio]MCG9552020.1 TRAP transporter substrate-binding protein [Vibrio sp. Isolate32]MCG9603392.1 TRAP transporter substrate-binding protein [Vibrio sp. Isolate31]
MKQKLLNVAILASSLFTGIASAADYTLKFGHLANDDNVWNKAALHFQKTVEEKSEGRIEVLVYPNSELGSEMDIINGIQLGTVDLTISGESLQNWAPKAALLAIPYAIRDSEHLAAVANGEIGKEIEEQITQLSGLVPLTWFERGSRNLTSNKPITTPEDLNGMILRVPNVPIFVKVWEQLGAKPTPMAFSEVFTSLQQGTIHSQENPLSLINSASFFEVQGYVNKTEHVRSWIYVVMGKRQLEKLPKDLQAVVKEAAAEMQAYERELFLEDERKLGEILQERGMKFVDVDQEAFREAALPAVRKSLNKEQLALFEDIQKL